MEIIGDPSARKMLLVPTVVTQTIQPFFVGERISWSTTMRPQKASSPSCTKTIFGGVIFRIILYFLFSEEFTGLDMSWYASNRASVISTLPLPDVLV